MAMSEEQKQRRALARQTKTALMAEADAIRREETSRRWRDEGIYLSREDLKAGVPCRGCGQPVIDGLGNWPPLMHLNEEEAAARALAESEYATRHPGCSSHRWSMSGSRATHCGDCCPPPLLGERQIEAIARILQRAAEVDPLELDVWRLTLTCSHTIERTAHRTNRTWTSSTMPCPACSQTRGVITSEKLPDSFQRRVAERTRLDREIERATDEVERQLKKLATAQRRLDELTAERTGLD